MKSRTSDDAMKYTCKYANSYETMQQNSWFCRICVSFVSSLNLLMSFFNLNIFFTESTEKFLSLEIYHVIWLFKFKLNGHVSWFQNNGHDEIWSEINWYNLPTDLQKDFMHLINRMQNGVKLTVGPLDSINRKFFKIVSAYLPRLNPKFSAHIRTTTLFLFQFHFHCRQPKRSIRLLCFWWILALNICRPYKYILPNFKVSFMMGHK